MGFLTEILFPKMEVRLIAINDNIDSDKGDNDFTPMMNVFNEWFVKNTSKKIRAVWQAKGKSGERLAVIPPYGYRKDAEDGKRLVIDEESAVVVRRIFRLSVEGHGPTQIARLLNSEHILNPSAYKYEHGILSKARPCKDPYYWNVTTVHKILDAAEYLGHTVNFKTWSRSYKDNHSRPTPPEKQLVFENTHPAIIDPETWEVVRKMREHKRRAPRYGNPGLFSGVAYCSDYGEKLYYHTRAIWNKARTVVRYEGSYSCSTYCKGVQYQEGRSCTCHHIGEANLEQLVLEELRDLLQFVSRNEKRFTRLVMDRSKQEQTREASAKKRAEAKHRRRISCFTEHRTLSANKIQAIITNLDREIDALGQMAASLIVAKREMEKHIRLLFALPCKDRDVIWNKKQNMLYQKLLGEADEITFVSEEYDTLCMKHRNRNLLLQTCL